MGMVYMDGVAWAFKWNVEHVFPQQSSCPIQENKCFTAVGIILLRCATFPDDARKVVPVPFCLHQLQNLRDFDRTVEFLHQTLQRFPLLGSCKNLAKCARILATDLAGQFHFNHKSFDWRIERHTLVLYLKLRVEVDTTSSLKNRKTWALKLENAKQIERYLKTECSEIRAGESKGMEEVKALFEIIEVDDDQNKKNDAACPICLDELYKEHENFDVARVCSCSHMFHAHYIGKWLRDKHSCPMCRSFSEISIQRGSGQNRGEESRCASPFSSINGHSRNLELASFDNDPSGVLSL